MMGMGLVMMEEGEVMVGVGGVMVKVSQKVSMMGMKVDMKVRILLKTLSMDYALSILELMFRFQSHEALLHMRFDYSLHFHCYWRTATVHDKHLTSHRRTPLVGAGWTSGCHMDREPQLRAG